MEVLSRAAVDQRRGREHHAREGGQGVGLLADREQAVRHERLGRHPQRPLVVGSVRVEQALRGGLVGRLVGVHGHGDTEGGHRGSPGGGLAAQRAPLLQVAGQACGQLAVRVQDVGRDDLRADQRHPGEVYAGLPGVRRHQILQRVVLDAEGEPRTGGIGPAPGGDPAGVPHRRRGRHHPVDQGPEVVVPVDVHADAAEIGCHLGRLARGQGDQSVASARIASSMDSVRRADSTWRFSIIRPL